MTNDEKRRAAIEYLGTKYLCHPKYDGKHNYMPDVPVNVAKTFKKAADLIKARNKQEFIRSVQVVPMRKVAK